MAGHEGVLRPIRRSPQISPGGYLTFRRVHCPEGTICTFRSPSHCYYACGLTLVLYWSLCRIIITHGMLARAHRPCVSPCAQYGATVLLALAALRPILSSAHHGSLAAEQNSFLDANSTPVFCRQSISCCNHQSGALMGISTTSPLACELEQVTRGYNPKLVAIRSVQVSHEHQPLSCNDSGPVSQLDLDPDIDSPVLLGSNSPHAFVPSQSGYVPKGSANDPTVAPQHQYFNEHFEAVSSLVPMADYSHVTGIRVGPDGRTVTGKHRHLHRPDIGGFHRQ